MQSMKLKPVAEVALLSALFLALAFAVAYPAFRFITWWGVHDWVQFYTYYGVPHRAVTQFGELPAWNPYYYGGNVQWGHPDDPTLSPLFILLLAFGVVAGTKIALLLTLAGGMYSMWILAGRLGLTRMSSFFAATVWGLNGWHAFHLAVGHCDHLTFLFEPLALYFFLRAVGDIRWSVGTAAVLALMYLSGGPYPFVFTAILVSVLALLTCGQVNSAKPVLAALASFVFAGALMAVKLLATLEFMLVAESVPIDLSGTGFGVLWKALFDPSLPMLTTYGGTQYGSWEYASFIGYIPAVLFLAGCITSLRKAWPWIIMGVIFLIASFGSTAPVNFFSLFTALPGLSGMHVPFRFIIHFIIAVALVGGMGLDYIGNVVSKGRRNSAGAILVAVITAAATGNLIWMHYDRPVPLYGLASYFLPPKRYGGELPATPPYKTLSRAEEKYVPQTYDEAMKVYLDFLESRRLSWGYDATRLPCAAKFPHQDGYRGEVYLAGAGWGSADLDSATLSTYKVSYTAGRGTTVVLNQNYAPGWRVEGARGGVYPKDGLAAADVSAGAGVLEFQYRPKTFLPGLVLSLIGLFGAALFVRRPPARVSPSAGSSPLPETS